MSKLPRISGRECVRALERAGFYVDRQVGSHIVMYRNDPYAKIIVPAHKELAAGTLRRILRDAGLSTEQFGVLLRGGTLPE